MINFILAVLSVFVLFNSINLIKSDEILGCGGFIKSHADIDFSKVEIKLYTKQGSLKDKTDCSPSNGYYFLPVYDKGEYVLKISPPPGWSFEPEFIEINFDGKSDVCSQGKDVNFAFKGFGITGEIAILGQTGGAKGVTVELKSDSSEVKRSTISDGNGIFYFTPVIPGKYTIRVSHPRWHFISSSKDVLVESGNTELSKDTFVISGFDVAGKFLIGPGQSSLKIALTLFPKKDAQNYKYNCQPPVTVLTFATSNKEYATSPVCYTQAKSNGDYLFLGIPAGKYLVAARIENKNVIVNIEPEYIEFEVVKDAVSITKSFSVNGYTVSGHVFRSQDGPVLENAVIKLNGVETTKTDSNGSYSLNNIKDGSYTIQVIADDLKFSDTTVKVSLMNSNLPDIIASGYKVCGYVVSKKSYRIAITKQSSTFHEEIDSKPESGEWCTFLPSGRFYIEVLTTGDDKSLGIQFFPVQQIIELNNSPLSGIIFSQLRAVVTGKVECLSDAGPACKDVTITLNSIDSDGKTGGQFATTTLQNGTYSFSDVLPGTYEVSMPSSPLCWEANILKLIVKSATEVIPSFIHTGYSISIVSSHNTKMLYKLLSNIQTKLSTEVLLTPGINSICVQKSGDYSVYFVSCHTYDADTLPVLFSTNVVTPITVTAFKHKNGIRVLSEISTSYKMMIDRGENTITVSLVAESNKIDGYFAYRYDLDLQEGEIVNLKPLSDIMLFKPESRDIVGGNDCVDIIFSFIASKGLIIKGNTQPAISDVRITLTFSNKPELAALETITDGKGEFKFGPLDGSLDVQLTASKESYVFSDFDTYSNTFKAHKLCEIIAIVKGDDNKFLSGVLLSLSGAESYRKNLVTGDDGTIKFHSLSPSQYYLRPMMKEYKFDPASKIIDVKDGDTVQVELQAHRVAYSVFGVITSLNGEPYPNIAIEAVPIDQCSQDTEDAISEANGQYRIRGLQPGCQYQVRAKVSSGGDDDINPTLERTIPIDKKILISKSDVKDINLIAISPINFVDVIARVFASSNDHYRTLRIQMYRKGMADSPIYSQRIESPLNPKGRANPGIMVYLPRIPLDGKPYVIELLTTLSEKNYRYMLPIESFIANHSSVYVELLFDPEVRLTESDINQNSVSALILLALVAVAFFKQDLAMHFGNIVWNFISSSFENIMAAQSNRKKETRFEPTLNENEINKLAQSINATKKKSVRKIT